MVVQQEERLQRHILEHPVFLVLKTSKYRVTCFGMNGYSSYVIQLFLLDFAENGEGQEPEKENQGYRVTSSPYKGWMQILDQCSIRHSVSWVSSHLPCRANSACVEMVGEPQVSLRAKPGVPGKGSHSHKGRPVLVSAFSHSSQLWLGAPVAAASSAMDQEAGVAHRRQ